MLNMERVHREALDPAALCQRGAAPDSQPLPYGVKEKSSGAEGGLEVDDLFLGYREGTSQRDIVHENPEMSTVSTSFFLPFTGRYAGELESYKLDLWFPTNTHNVDMTTRYRPNDWNRMMPGRCKARAFGEQI